MPPYFSGIDKPNRPMAFKSLTISNGTSSVSSTWFSAGTSRSLTNRRSASSNNSNDSSSKPILSKSLLQPFMNQPRNTQYADHIAWVDQRHTLIRMLTPGSATFDQLGEIKVIGPMLAQSAILFLDFGLLTIIDDAQVEVL